MSDKLSAEDHSLLKDVRYSKAQKMLKFTFNALIQQLLLQLLQKSVECYLIIWFSYRIFGILDIHIGSRTFKSDKQTPLKQLLKKL